MFQVFRIPVSIHWTFWLVMALFGGADRAQGQEAWLGVALFVLAGFISILAHELGHGLTARHFGARQISIQLYGMGGLCTFPGGGFSRKQDFLITAAGPATGFALAGFAFLGLRLLPADPPPYFHFLLVVLLVINLFWSTLNLLPILPLDGGHMLNATLGPRRRKTTLMVSMIAAVACIPFSIKFGLLIFPILLAWFAWESFKQFKELR